MSSCKKDYSNLDSCIKKCQVDEKTLLKNFTDFTLPGFHYLGPGSGSDNGPPTNPIDAIAQRHDQAYDQAVDEFKHSHNLKRSIQEIVQADQRFLQDMSQVPATTPMEVLGKVVGILGISLKAAMEKSLGIIFYPAFEKEKDDCKKCYDETISTEDNSKKDKI